VSDQPRRKLATIVALDVAGYSARAEADEARATGEVAALRGVIEAVAVARGGRIFNSAGDGFMLEFSSSLDAVEAAEELAQQSEPKVRIGVHLGDVMMQPNGDILGHGVNVAARLMAQAAPGSFLVSADVRRALRGSFGEKLVTRGMFKLDKMNETIEVFAIGTAGNLTTANPARAESLLVVLPFDNLSNDADLQFFSDGVAEEILQVLMNRSALKVIGRTSAFQYRGERKALAARELKATHILDGAVRKSGARMRVSAQLTEAATGAALWGERFDREIADAFELQDDIAAKVAGALQQTLQRASHTMQRINPAAYELYLRARPLATEWGQDKTLQAVTMLEETVARAPDFAPAWALLAAARAFLLPDAYDGIGEPAHAAALAAANRALDLDDKCAEAYRALAMLKPAFSEHGEKLRLIELAHSIAPGDPIISQARTIAHNNVGRSRDALACWEAAVRTEPMTQFNIGVTAAQLCAVGRLGEGLELIEDSYRRWPMSVPVWSFRLTIHMFAATPELAKKAIVEELNPPPGASPQLLSSVREIQDMFRAPFKDRKKLLLPMLDPSRGPLSLIDCQLAAHAGHYDLAFEKLLGALDRSEPLVVRTFFSTKTARAYLPASLFQAYSVALRQDPRFVGVCGRMGLIDYWHASGVWPDCADQVPYDFRAECLKWLKARR
jgi:adenylate cyclase